MPLNPFDMASDLGFNMSPLYLLGGLVVSVIGFYYWQQGRKRNYPKTKWTGALLMAYPIFVSNTFLMWCIGLFLWSVAYYFKSEGQ